MIQVKIIKGDSHEALQDNINAWFVLNDEKIDGVMDKIEFITDGVWVDDKYKPVLMARIVYETTIEKATRE